MKNNAKRHFSNRVTQLYDVPVNQHVTTALFFYKWTQKATEQASKGTSENKISSKNLSFNVI